MTRRNDNVVVGLDIGTTKTCAIVGEANNGSIEIIGIGSSPSEGLRKGVVVNIEKTVNSVRKAVEEAEMMIGHGIDSAYTGISGAHIHGFNSPGIIAIKEREVKSGDVKRVIDAAKAVAMPPDRKVLHVIPQEFIVDDQDGIQEPIGMTGVRLETRVHIVTGATTCEQNIVKCANRSGLDIRDIVLEQLASSEATLSSDEKELGVVLMDIGGGTTDIAIFTDGHLRYTSVLALGGNHITGDIAVGLRTPVTEAEKIKKKYGCAFSSMVNRNEAIQVPSVGGREPRHLPRRQLCEIIEPRMEEIFSLVGREFIKSGCDDRIAAGIVVTGGSALLEGLAELGERIFQLPVRIGYPTGVGGATDVVKNPMYSTGVGLMLYAHRDNPKKELRGNKATRLNSMAHRMKNWFEEAFL